MTVPRNIALFALLLTIATAATAQSRHRQRRTTWPETLIAAYTDSLQAYKHRRDTLRSRQNESGTTRAPKGEYYKLFVPLTFYHGMADKHFNIVSGESDGIDRAMIHIYMHRPELIALSQDDLDGETRIMYPSNEAVLPDVDIAETAATEAPDVDLPEVDIVVKKPNFWTFSADISIQMTQNYVSNNWYQGGESSLDALGTTTLKANYDNKSGLAWENTLEARLGLKRAVSDTLHTIRSSEDLLRYTTKLNVAATGRWSYAMQVIAATQMMKAYDSNDPDVNSGFLAPLTVTPSIGMNYDINWFKGRMTGSIYIAPFAMTYTYCSIDEIATDFGIDEGKHSSTDYGSEFKVEFDLKLSDALSWHSRTYCNTTYKRMLMEFENTLNMQVSRFLSCKLFVYPRFDDSRDRDDHHGYWHFKEWLSMGFSYSL